MLECSINFLGVELTPHLFKLGARFQSRDGSMEKHKSLAITGGWLFVIPSTQVKEEIKTVAVLYSTQGSVRGGHFNFPASVREADLGSVLITACSLSPRARARSLALQVFICFPPTRA